MYNNHCIISISEIINPFLSQVLSQSEILNKLVSGVVIDGQANPQAFAQYIQTSDIILIYGLFVYYSNVS